ncbi:hypothetical protein [Teredinibacter sp. KSP-S5-2]|uniref:hypothetical protein n=1 Tax=Teredinibacter sp. KSP-S5-2 TaxID=3034506 RepID=UPI00293533DB|nr:hypothetical protein [Teredinibacter sp. KSP-S5-2]WNO08342.1 hypothetical protein P5V12_15330 [Teredinibacter sp. KSP-S5-2]
MNKKILTLFTSILFCFSAHAISQPVSGEDLVAIEPTVNLVPDKITATIGREDHIHSLKEFDSIKALYNKKDKIIFQIQGVYQRNFCSLGTTPITSFEDKPANEAHPNLLPYLTGVDRIKEIKLREVIMHPDATPVDDICEITTQGDRAYTTNISLKHYPFMPATRVFLIDLVPQFTFPGPFVNQAILIFVKWTGETWKYEYIRVDDV